MIYFVCCSDFLVADSRHNSSDNRGIIVFLSFDAAALIISATQILKNVKLLNQEFITAV